MAPREERALVTGGAGFIGSHIVDALLESGYQVGILDDFSSGKRSNLPSGSQVVTHTGDVGDLAFVRRAIEGYKFVIHQAGRVSVTRSVEDPLATNLANVGGTLNLLLASKDAGIERFVYASSSSIYGETPTLPKTETMSPNPVSPYAVSKLAGEEYCRVFASVYGLKTVSLRYFNVYGPRQVPGPYSGVIPTFMRDALKGETPLIYGDGLQTRDFTFVGDVVQANLLCLSGDIKGGEVFNVASGKRVTINELAQTILALTGKQHLVPRHLEPRKGDVKHSLGDIGRITNALGYSPKHDLQSGLRQEIDWFRQQVGSNGSVDRV